MCIPCLRAIQLHLEICLKDLQEDYMGGTDVKISEPVVSFRETVSAESSQQCLSKSPNKHNRLYLSACPLESGIPEDVEEGRLNPRDDAKVCLPQTPCVAVAPRLFFALSLSLAKGIWGKRVDVLVLLFPWKNGCDEFPRC